MKSILLTTEERTLLLPLAKKRMEAWKQEQNQDSGSGRRFERSYLFPLQKAISKIFLETPAYYAPMEKAILAGCIRENHDEIRAGKAAAELSAINLTCKNLLQKLETRKTKLEVFNHP